MIAEYVTAARQRGLRVGLYYSVQSWRWRGRWNPAGFPADLPAMVNEVHAQVRELMTGYGPIDVLWYDTPIVPGGGDAATFWRAVELNAMVRSLQPAILINNRSGTREDFGTPEQIVKPEDGAWETCMTLNYAPGWGYLRHSTANKSPGEVLFQMISAVRFGGNFLFNVGPRPDGSIDDREGVVLDELGRWLRQHGVAVHGTQPTGIYNQVSWNQGPTFHYGMWTCRGRTAYLTLFYYPGDPLVVTGLEPGIVAARILTTGQPLHVERLAGNRTLLKGLPDQPPDPLATVVEVEFESAPQAGQSGGANWLPPSH